MKQFLLTTLIVCYSFSAFPQPNLTETQKIETLSKVWGFLKYYHPEVAAGKHNWDQQFIGILPEIKKAENSEQLSQVYIAWLDRLGTVKPCKKCNPDPDKEYFDKNFDLSWTQDSTLFTAELSSRLKYIEENRFQGKPYYLKSYDAIKARIVNEPEYNNFEYPDDKYRLLALAKYWNVVEYFFPYKYMTDQDWDDVLTEIIPKFTNAKDTTGYHLAMLELVTKTDDTHASLSSNYVSEFFGNKWIPATLKIIEGEAIITGFYNDSLAKVNDLKVGDVISKIDGKEIPEILSENFKYVPGSNSASKTRNALFKIVVGKSDSLNIYVERNGNFQNKKIARYNFDTLNYKRDEEKSEEKWKILEGNIGYIRMENIQIKDNLKAVDALFNCSAIIFDIRSYTYATAQIANNLIPTKKDFANFLYPDVKYPGKYYWGKAETGSNNSKPYSGLVVILVNEYTQSRAEYVTMALQTAEKAVTIGSQTAGADGNVNPFEFLGGYKTQISGLGIYYPDRTPAQRQGVKIDIEVKPSIQGIREGRDEVLEKALAYIKNNE
jgi:C-terminal processing protease CtpA/Prc